MKLLERWTPRFELARQRRLQHEHKKAQKARAELHRPERRRVAEARADRQRLWLARIVQVIRASILGAKLRANRDLPWGTAWDWDDDSESKDRSSRCGDARCGSASHDKCTERRASSASLDDRKGKPTLSKEKRRQERMQEYVKAASVIAQWFIAIKYQRIVERARWVPFFLGRCVRRMERAFRVRSRRRAVDLIVVFMQDTRRTGAVAIKRLQRCVRRVQAVVRIWITCRVARVALLEKVFIRQERLHREELSEINRLAQVLALERMQKNPMFGARTVRLYAANARLKKLLSLRGNSHISSRLRIRAQDAGSVRAGVPNADLLSFPDSLDADSHSPETGGLRQHECRSWTKADRRRFLEDLLRKLRRAHQLQSEEDYYYALRNMHKVDTSDVRKLLCQKTNDTAEIDAHILLSKPEGVKRHPLFCMLTRRQGAIEECRTAVT